MINNSIRFGAEVYTWYMHENGLTHAGKLGHMIEITSQAGFKGIEPIHYWMGNLKDPARLKDKLAEHRHPAHRSQHRAPSAGTGTPLRLRRNARRVQGSSHPRS